MKCCHFKMTGRGKRLPLLAVFKTGESHFIRNKQNLILKSAVEMKPDFSPESQSPFSLLWEIVAHFFFLPLCFPSPLFSPAHSHLESVNDQNLTEGLINSTVQRHPTSVLMARTLFFFLFSRCRHVRPATCQKNKHAFAVKKMLKEEKNVFA